MPPRPPSAAPDLFRGARGVVDLQPRPELRHDRGRRLDRDGKRAGIRQHPAQNPSARGQRCERAAIGRIEIDRDDLDRPIGAHIDGLEQGLDALAGVCGHEHDVIAALRALHAGGAQVMEVHRNTRTLEDVLLDEVERARLVNEKRLGVLA